MVKCKVCGSELVCIHCQTKKAGKKSALKRFEGLSKEEISLKMKAVRKAGK